MYASVTEVMATKLGAMKPTSAAARVCLFVSTLCGGGAERVMVRIATGLAERGWGVDLVLVTAKGPCLAGVPPSVRVVDLSARRTVSGLPALVRYLCRESPLAMLATLDHANVVALWAKRLARVPTRLVIREANTVSVALQNASSLKDRMLLRLLRHCYPWADALVAVSQAVADDLVQFVGVPRERIRIIHNPIDRAQLLASADEPLEHPWFEPGAPPVILGVGRLAPQKDFPTLVRAFAKLREKQEIRLVILGEGKQRPRLEALARQLGLADVTAFPGFTENPYRYMKRAATFVLPSRWEGLPNTLIEALALGTPVVATDCPGGSAEILEHGRWGKLVPPEDESALADAIEGAVQEGRRTPDEAIVRFDAGTVIGQYEEILLGNLRAGKDND